jgi:hypothetical protein
MMDDFSRMAWNGMVGHRAGCIDERCDDIDE